MSAGLIQRLEAILEPVWHHHNPFYRKDILMTALSRLAAAVGDLTAENADLKKQLADAHAKPAGASDQDLEGITSQIEAALGHPVADPDTGSSSIDPNQVGTLQPEVGTHATTVTNSATGSTTTLDHVSGETSTTDAGGASVPTDQAAADAAKAAATAAGVTVPGA